MAAIVPLLEAESWPIQSDAFSLEGIQVTRMAINLLRSVRQRVSVNQTIVSIVRSILPIVLPPAALPNSSIFITIATIGPITQVAVSLIDADGQIDGSPRILTVSGGSVSTTVILPGPVGKLWRLVVSDVGDPSLVSTSSPTLIVDSARLLKEDGGRLLLESGASLLA